MKQKNICNIYIYILYSKIYYKDACVVPMLTFYQMLLEVCDATHLYCKLSKTTTFLHALTRNVKAHCQYCDHYSKYDTFVICICIKSVFCPCIQFGQMPTYSNIFSFCHIQEHNSQKSDNLALIIQ